MRSPFRIDAVHGVLHMIFPTKRDHAENVNLARVIGYNDEVVRDRRSGATCAVRDVAFCRAPTPFALRLATIRSVSSLI
jgi:hypothetical protein